MITFCPTQDKSTFRGLLNDLDQLYPQFGQWLDGLILDIDTPVLLAQDQGHIIGVAIGKRSINETKLRCVRIHKDYRAHGVGIRLMDNMLDLLECRYPHVTVAEELIHDYSRAFVDRYGFSLDSVPKGLYRCGKLEYMFNAP